MAEKPTWQVLVDWRRSSVATVGNRCLNAGCELGTSGWSASAGINGAGTSIAQQAAAAYVRSNGLRIVCSGANGSGAHYTLPGTFASGRPYIARLPLKSPSGATTAGKVTLGSLGTGADRASTNVTLTANYGGPLVEVPWTPSAPRSDAQLAIMANAAAALTIDTDHVEVYEAINDISADVIARDGPMLTYGGGSIYDSSAPGTATVLVDNVEGKYDKRNAASPLFGLIRARRRILIRGAHIPSTYVNGDDVVHAEFYGIIRNVVPRPGTDLAEIICEDMLYFLKKVMYSGAGGADNITFQDFRTMVVQEAIPGMTLDVHGSVEQAKFYSFADRKPCLNVLQDIDEATGSMSYIEPQADTDLGGARYTVRDRNEVIDGLHISEHFDLTQFDTLAWLRNYDDAEDRVINVQRVRPHAIQQRGTPGELDLYWRKADVPFTIQPGADNAEDFFVDFSPEVPPYKAASGSTDQVGEYSYPLGRGFYMSGPVVFLNNSQTYVTGARVIEAVEHPKGIYFEIRAIGSPFTVTSLEVWGNKAVEIEEASGWRTVKNQTSIDEYDNVRGRDIDNPYIVSGKRAKALGKYITDRYAVPRALADLVVQDWYPSQLARQIGQRINVSTPGPELFLNQVPFVIRAFETRVGSESAETTWKIEEIPDTTPAPFIIGTSLIGGTDVIL